MALEDGKSPIVFDAVGQVVHRKIKISSIRAVRGDTDGQVTVTDDTDYPVFICFLNSTEGVDFDEVHLPANVAIYDGIKIAALPDNAHVYIYYE